MKEHEGMKLFSVKFSSFNSWQTFPKLPSFLHATFTMTIGQGCTIDAPQLPHSLILVPMTENDGMTDFSGNFASYI